MICRFFWLILLLVLFPAEGFGQVRNSNLELHQPSPNFPAGGPGITVLQGDSFSTSQFPSQRLGADRRLEIYADTTVTVNSGGTSFGIVDVYDQSELRMSTGSIVGVNLFDDATFSSIGGTVQGLNAVSGNVGIHGGAVELDTFQWISGAGLQSQMMVASEPSVDYRLDAGSLTANFGLEIGAGNKFIMDGGSFSGGLGIQGTANIASGNFSALVSVDGPGSTLKITGTEFKLYESINALQNSPGTFIAATGQKYTQQDLANLLPDPSEGILTGKMRDGSSFEMGVPLLSNGGTFNLVAALPEELLDEMDVAGIVDGGSDFAGGLDVAFQNISQPGSFSSDYRREAIGDLEQNLLIRYGGDGELTFDPATQLAQSWDLDFDGGFSGPVELTFGYNDSDLSVVEENLAIFHFNEDTQRWERLQIIHHDTFGNSITVVTQSFSPFVLGAAVAVPEPSATLLALAMLGHACRRRRSVVATESSLRKRNSVCG